MHYIINFYLIHFFMVHFLFWSKIFEVVCILFLLSVNTRLSFFLYTWFSFTRSLQFGLRQKILLVLLFKLFKILLASCFSINGSFLIIRIKKKIHLLGIVYCHQFHNFFYGKHKYRQVRSSYEGVLFS